MNTEPDRACSSVAPAHSGSLPLARLLTGVEQSWGESTHNWGEYIEWTRVFSADFERPDEGKQAKFVEVLDRSGPQEFIVRLRAQGPDCSDKCVMEVRNGGEIPGVAGQGAGEETGYVVDKMGNNDFDNSQGKPGSRG